MGIGQQMGSLLNPDSSTPFTVLATGKKHQTFADAVAAAEPGGTIEIAGDGPFNVHGMALDKSLVVRAAPGYEPAFRYEIPKGKDGVPIDPRDKPQYHQLFAVKPAPKPEAKPEGLRFEGVRFQVDAPLGYGMPLACFRGQGQMLQFLNCSMTTTAQEPAIGIDLAEPERVFFRNCQVAGFSPCLKLRGTAAGTPRGGRVVARDCLFFAPALLEARGDGKLVALFGESTVYVAKGFALAEHAGAFSCTAEHMVFKCDELFAAAGAGDRAWAGQKNIFEVGKWFGKGPAIREFDEWQKHWEGTDGNSASAVAPFFITQALAGFRHDMNGKDWAVNQAKAKRTLKRMNVEDRVGPSDFYLGPGDGFLQFREVGDYENWVKWELPSKRVKTVE